MNDLMEKLDKRFQEIKTRDKKIKDLIVGLWSVGIEIEDFCNGHSGDFNLSYPQVILKDKTVEKITLFVKEYNLQQKKKEDCWQICFSRYGNCLIPMIKTQELLKMQESANRLGNFLKENSKGS